MAIDGPSVRLGRPLQGLKMTAAMRMSKKKRSLLFSRRILPEATTMTTMNNSPALAAVTRTKRARPIASSTVVTDAARKMAEIASAVIPKSSNAVRVALPKPLVIGRRPGRSWRKTGRRGILIVAIGTTATRMTRGRGRIAGRAAAITRARAEGYR